MRLTLLERPTQLTAKDFRARLENELRELKGELAADLTFEGFSPNGWAQVDVSGEDDEIVAQLVANKFSLAQGSAQDSETTGVYDAEIRRFTETGLSFDFGLGPDNLNHTILTHNLQAQLADGKSIPLREVVDCYCLYPGMRISVRIAARDNDKAECWLSDEQIDRFSRWVTSGLDRIQAFECYRREAEAAVLNMHLSRDVIAVQPLTLTIQSIVCKLGTDAVGLIPKLGHGLKKQKLRPFLPKKIISRCRFW